MAGRGPAPKPDGERRRRNKPPTPPTVVVGDGEVRGPELPAGYDWPAPTRGWWETWRSSPQATTFTDTDWGFLLDTALLHAELWAGNAGAASELRLRVAKFGATPEDRARLRMSIEEPDATPAKPKGQRYSHLKVIGD
jgi:hypothetical protein